jgi:hypothetical protein
MNFGKWIVVAFVSFAAFIGTLVTVCVRQDISLVTRNYYEEEINHQQKINRLQNTQLLVVKPEIRLMADRITVSFSDFEKVSNGELKLLRPSNARLDHTFQISASQVDEQQFALPATDRGLYRASLKWTMDGQEYYIEKVIVL